MQTEPPINPSSLTRRHQRVGEEGLKALLAASIDAARRVRIIVGKTSTELVNTSMPQVVAHSADSRLPEKTREHLVKTARHHGLALRQNYNRVVSRLTALEPLSALSLQPQVPDHYVTRAVGGRGLMGVVEGPGMAR